MKNDDRLILLNEADNVMVCCQLIPAGETISVEGRLLQLQETIETGHKLARRRIARGEKIIRYGVAIGSSVRDIAPGEHVHLHNMKSDYIPPTLR